MHETQSSNPRAFLVGVELRRRPSLLNVEDSLAELAMLADTAGIDVVGQTSQRLPHPDPSTFIRSGKVEEVVYWAEELHADIILFDDELSPRHQRELEKSLAEGVRVLDRTALILDVFAQHAHTREGALQVELAQYEYRLPRLTRAWTHLARQTGGGAARGGAAGVGLRGPGETQLETDRREIGRRISHLKDELEAVRTHRERYRSQRKRSGISIISLVGYTNAGKSTLLNRLSQSDVLVADQLFATLDPTTRRVPLPSGRDVLFTDTVGFIQKLPHTLVAAFQATLEEIADADILLHVVDASHPNALQQIEVVNRTLYDDLGITEIPIMMVLNKVDLASDEEPEELARLVNHYPDALPISALTGFSVDLLLENIDIELASQLHHVTVRIPYTEGALLSRFYADATIESESHTDEYIEFEALLEARTLAEYEPFKVNE